MLTINIEAIMVMIKTIANIIIMTSWITTPTNIQMIIMIIVQIIPMIFRTNLIRKIQIVIATEDVVIIEINQIITCQTTTCQAIRVDPQITIWIIQIADEIVHVPTIRINQTITPRTPTCQITTRRVVQMDPQTTTFQTTTRRAVPVNPQTTTCQTTTHRTVHNNGKLIQVSTSVNVQIKS